MLSNLKNWRLLILTTLASVVLVGCSYFFGEKEKETEVSYNGKVGTCISPAKSYLRNYFYSTDVEKVSDEHLEFAVDCYQGTIRSFIDKTKSGGENQEEYSAENIFNFLQEFYPDFSLSQERIESYMRFKAFLIGGNPTSVTKHELEIVHKLVPSLGQFLQRLEPHRKILLQNESLEVTEPDYHRFKKAFKAFKSQLGRLMLAFDKYKGDREIEMDFLFQFLGSEFYGNDFESRIKYFRLLLAYKNFSMESSGKTFNRLSLSFLLRQAAITYESVAQFETFVKQEGENQIFANLSNIATYLTQFPAMLRDSSVFKGIVLKSLVDIFDSLEVQSTYAIRNHRGRKVPYEKVDEIIWGLTEAEMIEEGMARALTTFLQIFSQKWLDPHNQGERDLTRGKVTYIRELLSLWVERQQVLNTLFEGKGDASISLNKKDRGPVGGETFDEWIEVLDGVSVHQWDDLHRVRYSQDLGNFSYEELTVSNSIMFLAELFMRPYNLDQKKLKSFSLQESETQEIYITLRIIGVELAFFDSRVFNSGERAYMEGNNFSSQKNNDNKMDFFESYEYLSVALSSGKLADRIHDEIPSECHLDYADVHHQLVTKKACFENLFKENFARYFDHLPLVKNFWQKSKKEERDWFYGSLEIASRAGVVTDRPVDLGEIRTMVSVAYYLQAIFDMFDYDGDGEAKGQELKDAEKHFRPMIEDFLLVKHPDIVEGRRKLLRNMVCSHVEAVADNVPFRGSKEHQALAKCMAPKIFIHLIKHGSLPTGVSTSSLAFLKDNLDTQGKKRDPWLNADGLVATPVEVIKVFSALAKITHQGHVHKIRDFLMENREDLLSSLVEEEAPKCLEKSADHPFKEVDDTFCVWARKIYCNETVNQDVYRYFKENKYNLFPEDNWNTDPKKSAEESMVQMYFTFKGHQKFSTLCAFPLVEPSLLDEMNATMDKVAGPVSGFLNGDTENEGFLAKWSRFREGVGKRYEEWKKEEGATPLEGPAKEDVPGLIKRNGPPSAGFPEESGDALKEGWSSFKEGVSSWFGGKKDESDEDQSDKDGESESSEQTVE